MEKITKRTVVTYILTALNIWLWGYFLIKGVEGILNLYTRGQSIHTSAIIFITTVLSALALSIATAFFCRQTSRSKIALPAQILFLVGWILLNCFFDKT